MNLAFALTVVVLASKSLLIGKKYRLGGYVLTWVFHRSANTKSQTDFGSSIHSQDLGPSSGREGALIAANIRPIGVGAIADVRGRVGGELDGVVLGGPCEVSDVSEASLRSSVDDVSVEEVVRRRGLRERADEEGRDLHISGRRLLRRRGLVGSTGRELDVLILLVQRGTAMVYLYQSDVLETLNSRKSRVPIAILTHRSPSATVFETSASVILAC